MIYNGDKCHRVTTQPFINTVRFNTGSSLLKIFPKKNPLSPQNLELYFQKSVLINWLNTNHEIKYGDYLCCASASLNRCKWKENCLLVHPFFFSFVWKNTHECVQIKFILLFPTFQQRKIISKFMASFLSLLHAFHGESLSKWMGISVFVQ